MANRYLLGTNASVALLNGNEGIARLLSENVMYVPIIALAELYYGAEKSGRVTQNHRRIEEFRVQRTVLVCDVETARWYGRIYNQLRRKGRPIPQNDVWIAAIALQHGLTLLTRDVHFNEVESLQVEGW